MEFRTILTVILVCMCVDKSLAKKMKPDRLVEIMNLLKDPRDESLKIDKRSAGRHAVKDICTFPEDSKVVTENNNKLVDADQPFCQPRPVALPINVPIQHVIYPTYVTLHRCLGGFYSRLERCVASKKEKIFVRYLDLLSYRYENATMYSHTECTSNCIFKPEDCNPETETFKNCHCNCNIKASHCNSTWQTFNSHACKCDCKYIQQCDIQKEWNPVTCQCQCLKCLRDLCGRANLQMNEETCQCFGQAVVSRRSSSMLSLFTKRKSTLFSYKKH